jgi:hypothetical protein
MLKRDVAMNPKWRIATFGQARHVHTYRKTLTIYIVVSSFKVFEMHYK